MSENPMAAFRRGSARDRERRAEAAGQSGAEDLSNIDELLEQQRSAAGVSVTERPSPQDASAAASQVDAINAEPEVRYPAEDLEVRAEAEEPEPPAPRAEAESPAARAGGEDRRGRKATVYNLSPEVVGALRLLRVAREMDYPELIATAFSQAGGRVKIADDAVRKRTRFRGEKVTVVLDLGVKEAIRVAAQERNMNASAYVTAFLEMWVPKKALKGGVDL